MAESSSLLVTPLHDQHVELAARMVPFGGWDMPVQYLSILDEHRAVREAAGIFDVSHMGRIEFAGAGAGAFLQRLFTCDVSAIEPGHGRYCLLCTESGGILDDTILYRRSPEAFLLVCNAGNRLAVLAWLDRWRQPSDAVAWQDRTLETVMIALQGPQAPQRLADLGGGDLATGLPYFGWAEGAIAGQHAFVARTGYTGEDGFEIIAEAAAGSFIWQALVDGDVTPCGLGARDTLRLEAALPLHGNDISPETNPVEAGLLWTVALDKGDFLGAGVIRQAKEQGPAHRLVGFEIVGRGIPRAHQDLLVDGRSVGTVTSGTFSPTLQRGIGMGYVETSLAKIGIDLTVDVRGAMTPARIVRRPFYKRAG